MVVRHESSTYTLTRTTSNASGSLGEVSDTQTTVDRDLWLFEDVRTQLEELFGEEIRADLGGVALQETDVQYGDELDYGSGTYKVEDEPSNVPAEDPDVITFTLERVNN